MAVLSYILISLVPFLAVVHADCGPFKVDCSPHCCSAGDECFKHTNGTRFCGKSCTGGRYGCRLQFRCCGLDYCCKETDSCCGLKGCCPPGHTCCTDMGEYCCPDGHSCSSGMCSSFSLDDSTSSSGSHWHYAGIGGGAFFFIIIPVCWVRRRKRVMLVRRTTVRVSQRPGQRVAGVRNANRTAAAAARNVTAYPTQLNPLDIRNSTHGVPVHGVNHIQSGLPVEPPPYSEFVDDSDKNKLHDSKTVQDV